MSLDGYEQYICLTNIRESAVSFDNTETPRHLANTSLVEDMQTQAQPYTIDSEATGLGQR